MSLVGAYFIECDYVYELLDDISNTLTVFLSGYIIIGGSEVIGRRPNVWKYQSRSGVSALHRFLE